jgi:hypothetical protein
MINAGEARVEQFYDSNNNMTVSIKMGKMSEIINTAGLVG